MIQIAKNIVTHPSIQHRNTIQTWTITLHSTLAIETVMRQNRDAEIPDMCITINMVESCTDI